MLFVFSHESLFSTEPSLMCDSPSNDADTGRLNLLRLNFLPSEDAAAPE